jgi:hypothetical protein
MGLILTIFLIIIITPIVLEIIKFFFPLIIVGFSILLMFGIAMAFAH